MRKLKVTSTTPPTLNLAPGQERDVLLSDTDGVLMVRMVNGAAGGGDASAANQVTQTTKLTSLDTKTPALGLAAAAASRPVVLASDQAALPLPVATASGSITIQNSVPAGVATANSAVEVTLAGMSSLAIQSVGTFTGALSLQVTLDGTNWITLGGTPLINLNTGGYLASITSALQGIFQADVGGALKARVTALAAVTGTAVVTLRAIPCPVALALDTALPTGANVVGGVTQSGTWTVMPGNTANSTPWLMNVVPNAALGASTTHHLVAAATTNATSVKASAGVISAMSLSNPSAAAKYVKFFNKASAPTVGTDTPVLSILVPAGATISPDTGAFGIRFSTGIAMAITGAAADLDNTAVAAADVITNLFYT